MTKIKKLAEPKVREAPVAVNARGRPIYGAGGAGQGEARNVYYRPNNGGMVRNPGALSADALEAARRELQRLGREQRERMARAQFERNRARYGTAYIRLEGAAQVAPGMIYGIDPATGNPGRHKPKKSTWQKIKTNPRFYRPARTIMVTVTMIPWAIILMCIEMLSNFKYTPFDKLMNFITHFGDDE